MAPWLRLSAALGFVLAVGRVAAPAARSSASCPGYKASNIERLGDFVVGADLTLDGGPCNAYGRDIEHLKLQVEYQTVGRLHVHIYDAAEQAYQVPESVLPRPENSHASPHQSELEFSMAEKPFSFTIKRRGTGETVFDTSGHPMVFESQYLRLRTRLPDSPNIYGLGESTDPFRLPTEHLILTPWSRDAGGTPEYTNLYGNHAVYYDHRGQNGTHGVFLLNSNGMDIEVNRDSDGQYLEYRTIGGVLDFFFLGGPTPKDVAVQYSETVGKPAMMPYWSFGFHNCRYGYRDAYELAETIANYSAADIPLETQWTDIDYMDRCRDFTLDPYRFPLDLMKQVVDHLHNHSQRYVVIVDPAPAYHDYPPFINGVKEDVFLKISNGSIYKPVVWPGVAAYPDWFAPGTQRYWDGEFATFFHGKDGLDIDGLWIDMNEPSNFCDFPCSDPEGFATSSLDPPAPPPMRLSPPRPIPGFGPDFQPTCHATVNFDCYAQTHCGETIFIVGNTTTLGDFDVMLSAPMTPKPCSRWEGTVQMPANTTITYQFVRRQSDGSWIHEAQNRTLHTGGCYSSQNTDGTITTASRPHKRSLQTPLKTTSAQSEACSEYHGPKKGFPGRNLLAPDYTIHNAAGALSMKTARTDIIQSGGYAMYDTHNLYGTMMSATSRNSMLMRRPTVRPVVITRSTFAGAGAKVGHWLGDMNADWTHYLMTIAGIQNFAALFQIPMVGSDICGFLGPTTDNLCSRWVFLGAFSPFFRDHSDMTAPPHPLYVSPQVAASGRAAIHIRYRLLDYAYTAMWTQTQTGAPMINPMFFQYPDDNVAAGTSYQFFWGDGIMVAPVTESEDSLSVSVYFPADKFYDFYTGAPVEACGTHVTLNNVGYDTIPLYFKGGSIVPMRADSAFTLAELRKENFVVVVAPGRDGSASGSLYLDDGESIHQRATSNIEFNYRRGLFQMMGQMDYDPGVVISQIVILGVDGAGRGGSYNATNKKATYDVHLPLTRPFVERFWPSV